MGRMIYIFFITFFLWHPLFSDGENDNREGSIIFELDNDEVIIEIVYYENTDIIKEFKGKIKSDYYGGNVIEFHDNMVLNSFGEILISFKNYTPTFYGFKIVPFYPTNGYPPGLSLIPYFDLGESVGDHLSISWDNENNTFKKLILDIP